MSLWNPVRLIFWTLRADMSAGSITLDINLGRPDTDPATGLIGSSDAFSRLGSGDALSRLGSGDALSRLGSGNISLGDAGEAGVSRWLRWCRYLVNPQKSRISSPLISHGGNGSSRQWLKRSFKVASL